MRASKSKLAPDYPLQGSALDVFTVEAQHWTPKERRAYIRRLLGALAKEMKNERMALKNRVSFKDEMRDLRKLLKLPPDAYLRVDQRTGKRNVLMVRSPGNTHTFWSRTQMWKMATKQGDLRSDVFTKNSGLVRRLDKLLDYSNPSKATFREGRTRVLPMVLAYTQQQYNTGVAFPPFHARFLADRYLPSEGDGIVVDPCAGWGGRLLGTLCVPRHGRVRYVGVDPNRHNREAYAGLIRRVRVWMKREMPHRRTARVFAQPFERWIRSATAKRLRKRVDLVITSPPYFRAELYETRSRDQSANRYREYEQWRNQFLRPLIAGAYRLLKPGGILVLNIADVTGASLERDTRRLAREAGFVSREFFKLAMSRSVGTKSGRPRHSVEVDGVVWKHEPVFCFSKRPEVEK